MKQIIVPFDFSSYSLAALKTAQRISSKSGAEICCVTVIPAEVDWDRLGEEAKQKYPELLESYQEAQEVLPDHIRKIAPAKAPIRPIIRIGMPNELILRVIQEEEADLVVIGAYGKGYTEGKFIGSTLQKILRHTSCLVLAVKEAMDGNDFRKIAFASDFSPKSKLAFEQIKPLIKLFKSSVYLLFINTPAHFTSSEEVLAGMNLFAKGHEELTFHQHIFNDTETERGMIAFGESHQIKWFALVSGDHARASAYQVGTTETLLFRSDCCVLSVKV